MLDIPIVVVTYNRADSLSRLLNSIINACYCKKVKLIICIDGEGSSDVIEISKSLYWPHGEKEIIIQEKNIGLKEHILFCGRLSYKYDGIIMLEDDLYVSPHFYSYTLEAQTKYKDEKNISGIALYSHQFNETAYLPFEAFDDGFDIFFMQIACSWGQSWLTQQWENFDNWYNKNLTTSLIKDTTLPPDVQLWPDTSWKKYFIKYLIESNRFFVYPRRSYITNFGELGQNHKNSSLFQVSLAYGIKKFYFPSFDESFSKYDSFCEIKENCLKHYQPNLKKYNFDVDLYGLKNKNNNHQNYILTKQKSNSAVLSFGRKLKPHELNILTMYPGEEFFLIKKEAFKGYKSFYKHRYFLYTNIEQTHKYYYLISNHHYPSIINKIKLYMNFKAIKLIKSYIPLFSK